MYSDWPDQPGSARPVQTTRRAWSSPGSIRSHSSGALDSERPASTAPSSSSPSPPSPLIRLRCRPRFRRASTSSRWSCCLSVRVISSCRGGAGEQGGRAAGEQGGRWSRVEQVELLPLRQSDQLLPTVTWRSPAEGRRRPLRPALPSRRQAGRRAARAQGAAAPRRARSGSCAASSQSWRGGRGTASRRRPTRRRSARARHRRPCTA